MDLQVQEQIENLLISTGRDDIEDLLTYMRVNGFYEAPCSSQYHLCMEGGLAEHSLNVFNVMFDMAGGIKYLHVDAADTSKYNSIIIVSLLHDIGKMGQFNKPNYIPNMIKSKKKDEGMVRSETKPFTTNSDLLPIPHEIRSIQIASQFIELTEEENYAILMHNGLYGDLKYQLNGKERPLQMLLHFADMWASRVIEMKQED